MSQPAVTAELSRSWYLVPAFSRDRFSRALTTSADQLILDLEDGVPEHLKVQAAEFVTEWLSSGHQAWVRIGARRSSRWEADLAAIRELPGLIGLMLPKSESALDVEETYEAVLGRVPIIPLVESALGIEMASEIARARGVARLAFGVGDYRRDTGVASVSHALAYPRSRLVIASRAARLPGPIDGPSIGDELSLQKDCWTAVELGMTGKLCLRDSQPETVNAALSPSQSDIDWAVEQIGQRPDDAVSYDGSVAPRLAQAESILQTAAAFGLIASVV